MSAIVCVAICDLSTSLKEYCLCMYLQQHRYGNRLTFVFGSVLLKVCRHLTFDSMHNNYIISTCVHVFTGCLSNSAFSKKLRSSRIRLCWLHFRRTSTNSYSAKWRRGLCGPPTLRVSLCRGHTLRQPSECSVWRLRTSGTHYGMTFATPVCCQAFFRRKL